MSRSSTAPWRALRGDSRRGFCACLAQALWYLGYPDQALQRSQEALTLARGAWRTPSSLAEALIYAAISISAAGRGTVAHAQAEAAHRAVDGAGVCAFRVAEATVLRGWALAEQGQGEAGHGADPSGDLPPSGPREPGCTAVFLTLLAEACWSMGQTEEGLARAWLRRWRRGHSTGSVTAERSCIGSKGSCCCAGAAEHQAQAETCFQQALDVARRQQAKSWSCAPP